MVKISEELLSEYITYPVKEDNLKLGDLSHVYSVVNRNSDTLVITVGDSWTYGLLLPDRMKQVYGSLVAAELNADWLNISLPGQGNFWITARFVETIELIKTLNYNKIYIVCTFTEIGRSLISHLDNFIDYRKWLRNYQGNNIYTDFLQFINTSCIDRINEHAAQDPRVTVRIGLTWPDALGFSPEKNCFDKSWLDVIRENNVMPIDHVCYAAMHGIEHLKRAQNFFSNAADFLEWYNHVVEAGTQRLDFMARYPDWFENKHTLAPGHQLWANYIINCLKESK
jgi:hypothetical protein